MGNIKFPEKEKRNFLRGNKLKFLQKLNWAMSVLMLCSMSFIFGSCYQVSNLLIPHILIFIGALGKIVINHYAKKQKKAGSEPPAPPPSRRYK